MGRARQITRRGSKRRPPCGLDVRHYADVVNSNPRRFDAENGFHVLQPIFDGDGTNWRVGRAMIERGDANPTRT